MRGTLTHTYTVRAHEGTQFSPPDVQFLSKPVFDGVYGCLGFITIGGGIESLHWLSIYDYKTE